MKIFLVSLGVLVFSFNTIYCATLNVVNNSGETVKVLSPVDNKSYDSIQNTESKTYNSGFKPVNSITWVSGDNAYVAKITLNWETLGARFEIKGNGSYEYDFNVGGHAKGKADKVS
jgi:hypothetical protein